MHLQMSILQLTFDEQHLRRRDVINLVLETTIICVFVVRSPQIEMMVTRQAWIKTEKWISRQIRLTVTCLLEQRLESLGRELQVFIIQIWFIISS